MQSIATISMCYITVREGNANPLSRAHALGIGLVLSEYGKYNNLKVALFWCCLLYSTINITAITDYGEQHFDSATSK